jgi:nucleoside 2-deoxyribosyltransferase
MRDIYIASRFGRREEALSLAEELKKLGHNIISTWFLPGQAMQVNNPTFEEELTWNLEIANRDWNEIFLSDTFITLTEDMDNLPEGAARGGRHAEFGMAVALHKTIYLIGQREHVFHYLPEVSVFGSTEDFLDYVRMREHLNNPL